MNRRNALKVLTSLPAVAQISVASLKPDDVIVVECDQPIHQEGIQRITSYIEQVFTGHRCVVMCDGLKLKVLRHD